jgi:hypothetical protein
MMGSPDGDVTASTQTTIPMNTRSFNFTINSPSDLAMSYNPESTVPSLPPLPPPLPMVPAPSTLRAPPRHPRPPHRLFIPLLRAQRWPPDPGPPGIVLCAPDVPGRERAAARARKRARRVPTPRGAAWGRGRRILTGRTPCLRLPIRPILIPPHPTTPLPPTPQRI